MAKKGGKSVEIKGDLLFDVKLNSGKSLDKQLKNLSSKISAAESSFRKEEFKRLQREEKGSLDKLSPAKRKDRLKVLKAESKSAETPYEFGEAKKDLKQARRLARSRSNLQKIVDGETKVAQQSLAAQTIAIKDQHRLASARSRVTSAYNNINKGIKQTNDEGAIRNLNSAAAGSAVSLTEFSKDVKKLKTLTDPTERTNTANKLVKAEKDAYKEDARISNAAQTRVQNLGKAELAAYAEVDRKKEKLRQDEIKAYTEDSRITKAAQTRVQNLGKAELAAYAEVDRKKEKLRQDEIKAYTEVDRRKEKLRQAEVKAYAEDSRISNAAQTRVRNLGKAELAAYAEVDRKKEKLRQAEIKAYTEDARITKAAQTRVQNLGKAELAAYAEVESKKQKIVKDNQAKTQKLLDNQDRENSARRKDQIAVQRTKAVADDVFNKYGAKGFKDLDIRSVKREDLGALQKYAAAEQKAAENILLRAQAQKKSQATVNSLTGALQKQTTVVRQLEARFRSLHSPLAQVSLLFRQFFRFAIGYGVLYQALGAVTALARGVADLDEQLFSIQAITAASTKEMKDLETTIKRVATTTKFSTNEIAAATRVLGQAGVEATDLPGALQATADFAAATASSLEISADLITTTRNIFKDLDDNTLADQLTKAINISKLTAGDLKTILSISAQTAKSYNLTSEQYLAAATTLRNAGIKASTVATGLRQGLLEVFSPTTATIKAIKERYKQLGDEVTEEVVRQRFFGFKKADNPLLAVLSELKRLGFADEAQKEFQRAFNVRASNAIKALVNNYDELAESESRITFGISAAEAADIQMMSLNNSLSNLGAAFTVLGDQILGDGVGVLEQYTDSITGVINKLSELDVKLKSQGKRGLGAALIPAGLGGLAGAFAGRSIGGKLAGAALGTTAGAAAGVGEGGVSAAGTAGLLGITGLLGGSSLLNAGKSAIDSKKTFGRLNGVASSGRELIGASGATKFAAKFGLGRAALALIPAIGPFISMLLTVGSLVLAFTPLLSGARSPAEAAASQAEAAATKLATAQAELDKLKNFSDEFDIDAAEKGNTKGKAANSIVSFGKSFTEASESIDKVFGTLTDGKKAEIEDLLREFARSGTARRGEIGNQIRGVADVGLEGDDFDRVLFGLGTDLRALNDNSTAFQTEFSDIFVKAQEFVGAAVDSQKSLDDPEYARSVSILKIFNDSDEFQQIIKGRVDTTSVAAVKLYKDLARQIQEIEKANISTIEAKVAENEKETVRARLAAAVEQASESGGTIQLRNLIAQITSSGVRVGDAATKYLAVVDEVLKEELVSVETEFEQRRSDLRNLRPATRSPTEAAALKRIVLSQTNTSAPAIEAGILDVAENQETILEENSADLLERLNKDKALLVDLAVKIKTESGDTEARGRAASIGGDLGNLLDQILEAPADATQKLVDDYTGKLTVDDYKIDPDGAVQFNEAGGKLDAFVDFAQSVTTVINNTLAGEAEYNRLTGELPSIFDLLQVDQLERHIKRITSTDKSERYTLLDSSDSNNPLILLAEARKNIQAKLIEGIKNDIFELGGDNKKLGKLDKAGAKRLIDLQKRLGKEQANLQDIDPETFSKIKKLNDDVEKDRIKQAKKVATLGLATAQRWIELAGITTDPTLFKEALNKIDESRASLRAEIAREVELEGDFKPETDLFNAEVAARELLLRGITSNGKELIAALDTFVSGLNDAAKRIRNNAITSGNAEQDALSEKQGVTGNARRRQASAQDKVGASVEIGAAKTKIAGIKENLNPQFPADSAAAAAEVQVLENNIVKLEQEMAAANLTLLENSEITSERDAAEMAAILNTQLLTEGLQDANAAYRNFAETTNNSVIGAIDSMGDALAQFVLDGGSFKNLLGQVFLDLGRELATNAIKTMVNELATSALGSLGGLFSGAASSALTGAASATADAAALGTAATAAFTPATIGLTSAAFALDGAAIALSASAAVGGGSEAASGIASVVGGALAGSASGSVIKGGSVIKSFARGGMISGPGTATSDSIPIMASDGESILNAKATEILGEGFIHDINRGNIGRFSTGGVVQGRDVLAGASPAKMGGAAGPTNVQNKNETTIVNAIDSASVVAAGMETTGGKKAILNFIKVNKSQVKRIIN